MNTIVRIDEKEEINSFHKKVLILSSSRGSTRKVAYDFVERRHKKVYGARRFKNYESYRKTVSYYKKGK